MISDLLLEEGAGFLRKTQRGEEGSGERQEEDRVGGKLENKGEKDVSVDEAKTK